MLKIKMEKPKFGVCMQTKKIDLEDGILSMKILLVLVPPFQDSMVPCSMALKSKLREVSGGLVSTLFFFMISDHQMIDRDICFGQLCKAL